MPIVIKKQNDAAKVVASPTSARAPPATATIIVSGARNLVLPHFACCLALYLDDESEKPWIHVHGGLLVPSPLLFIVPAALEIVRVLPTTEDVTIEAGLARSAVDCPDCGLPNGPLQSVFVRAFLAAPATPNYAATAGSRGKSQRHTMVDSRSTFHGEGNCTILTANQALKLADAALKAGRHESAICYLNIAYALFDADHQATCSSTARPNDH